MNFCSGTEQAMEFPEGAALQQAQENLAELKGWRFPASTVMRATGMNSASLTNVLSKTDLILCSETAGQGKARKYCLIDAYQLALLNRLVLHTGRMTWCVDALNRFLFSEIYTQEPASGARVADFPETKQRKERLCCNLDALPIEYTDRSNLRFCCVSTRALVQPVGGLTFGTFDDERMHFALLDSATLVNVTYLFMHVDSVLAETLR